MADDLSGLMDALGVNNSLSTPYVRAVAGSAATGAAADPAAQTAPAVQAAPVSQGVPGTTSPKNGSPINATQRPQQPPAQYVMPTAQQQAANQAAYEQRMADPAYRRARQRAIINNARDSAAQQLLNRGMYAAYGGEDAYMAALNQASMTPLAGGGYAGNAGFQKEAAQKGYQQLLDMPEYQSWGLDNYDWSKLGVNMPPAAAAAPASRTPQQLNRQRIQRMAPNARGI